MIVIGGEGEEEEKVNLKICLAGELNPGLQRDRRANKILNRCVLIFSQIAHFNLSIFNIDNYHFYVYMSFCDI